MRGLVPSSDDNLLVGHENSDDAAVYRLRDDLAIVFTTDFFTPIVDDAFDWGRIAAANALSDIYAMGGTPLLALNLVAWPREGLPLELLARVIDGGAQVVAEADAIVAGGHSIDDSEPKFGMAVVGTVDPKRVFRNVGALPGDLLVLTKPIGLGVISTAIKRDAAPTKLIDEAIRIMTTLNADARDAAVGAGDHVHAVTDVTGFSLLGHLNEMVATPGIGAMIEASSVPVIDGVRDLIKKGMVAGGTQRNHAFVSEFADWGDLAENEQLLLTDAQTSGGLLIAVAPEGVDDLVDSLKARGTPAAAVIGRVVDNPASRLIIT